MARTRVTDNARVSNLQYEGTLGVQDIDQDPLADAVGEYNEMREDEFGRLEKNMTAVSDLQNEILGEKFDNVVQMQEFDQLRDEYGISDQDMWGVDLDNEYSSMALQKKANRMMQDPRYQELQREKVLAQKATDYLAENAEKLGDLAPRLAHDLNRYYENTDPNEKFSAMDINVSDYIPVDLDEIMTTVNENMSDEISTIINRADDPDAAWVSQLISRSKERFARIAQEYMLKDEPATRNTMLERGYIAEDEDTGEYFITTRGQQEINKQQDIFAKNQEKYQSQIRVPKGGKNRFEELEVKPNTTRWAYFKNETQAGERARALDRLLYDSGVPVSILNNNTFGSLVKNYGEKPDGNMGDQISNMFEQYPKGLFAYPLLDTLRHQLQDELSSSELDRLNNYMENLEYDVRAEDLIDEDGRIVIDGTPLENRHGSKMQLSRVFSNGFGDYSQRFEKAVYDNKVSPPRHWSPNYQAPRNQYDEDQFMNTNNSGGNRNTQSVTPEDADATNTWLGPIGNLREGGAVGSSNLSSESDMDVVEDYDKNWDYAKMGNTYMTKKKGTEDWKPVTGEAKEAIANKVFNRGNVKMNVGMERADLNANEDVSRAEESARKIAKPYMDSRERADNFERKSTASGGAGWGDSPKSQYGNSEQPLGPPAPGSQPEQPQSQIQSSSYDLSEDNEDLSNLKSLLADNESGGGTYNILNDEDGNGKLIGPGSSTAVGKYQMIWSHQKDGIKKFVDPVPELTPEQKKRFENHPKFSKLSDEDLRYIQAYLDDPEAQEKHFNHYDETDLTSYSDRFKRKAPEAAKVLNDVQIKKLIHFLGPGGSVKAAKNAQWNVNPTADKGVLNSTISKYLNLTPDQLAKLEKNGGGGPEPTLAR